MLCLTTCGLTSKNGQVPVILCGYRAAPSSSRRAETESLLRGADLLYGHHWVEQTTLPALSAGPGSGPSEATALDVPQALSSPRPHTARGGAVYRSVDTCMSPWTQIIVKIQFH